MEDDFYATIKFKNGEEIFCKVSACEENDRTFLLVSNPITVGEVKGRSGTMGYKLEPWLKTTTEDMLIVNFEDILTMSESSDIEMIVMYQTYVRSVQNKNNGNNHKISKEMGYISSVNDAKDILEKLYRSK